MVVPITIASTTASSTSTINFFLNIFPLLLLAIPSGSLFLVIILNENQRYWNIL
jgi:hypothetical protein